MNTQEALLNLFSTYSNKDLSELLGVNYNTLTTYKYNFRNNKLSLEKQIELLSKSNHQLISNLLWKKQAK
jgi:hypothetical protein